MQVAAEMDSYVVGDTDFSSLADATKQVELSIQPLRMMVRMYLQSALRSEIAALVNLPPTSIQLDSLLPMLGIKSIRRTSFQEVLKRKLGCVVSGQLLANCTIAELAVRFA